MKRVHLGLCFCAAIALLSCNEKSTASVSAQSDNIAVQKEEVKEKVWSEEFAKEMQKAKQYEESKNWIFALHSYYVAMQYSIGWEELNIAYKAYKELADIIESGKPGRGTFDTFSLYESWKNLLIDAEDFGNKLFPYELYFGSFRKENLNLSEKKADYLVPVSYHLSDRYFKTIGVVSKGYAKVDKSGWTELPEEFPGAPVTKDSVNIRFNDTSKSSFAFSVGVLSFPEGNSVIPYEGIFVIVDKNGNELAESEPYVIGSKTSDTIQTSGLLPGLFSYQEPLIPFKNVSENGIREIEAGNAHVYLKKINLFYGKVTAESDFNAARYIKGKNKVKVLFADSDIHYQGSKCLNKARFLFALNAIKKESVSESIGCCLLNSKDVFQLIFAEDYIYLDKTKFIILCNELSKTLNREPVYKVNGSSEVCDIVANFSSNNLTIDKNADGFRAPTLNDINYCLSVLKDAPALEKTSGLFFDSYNYQLFGEDQSKNANLLLYYF